jgi:hypothetical protein
MGTVQTRAVICMDSYRVLDLTQRARDIAAAHDRAAAGAAPSAPAAPPAPAGGLSSSSGGGGGGGSGGGGRSVHIPGYGPVAQRAPAAVYSEGPDGLKVAARALGLISYGSQEVQLSAVEQVISSDLI